MQEVSRTVKNDNVVKEVLIRDTHGEIMATMWNQVARASPTRPGKRIRVTNSLASYDSFKRRVVVKINELCAIIVSSFIAFHIIVNTCKAYVPFQSGYSLHDM